MSEPIVVSSRGQIEAIICAAVERAVSRLSAARHEPERPAIGWVTNAEARRLLGLSTPTLARWRADGTLPFSKVGRKVYYERAAIDGLLASRRAA